MLSKIAGPTVALTLTSTAQTVVPTTFDGKAPKVVRIAAVTDAFVNFSTTATTNTGILILAGTAEHFKLENTTVIVSTGTSKTIPSNIVTYAINTATVSVLQAGSGGLISVTPVA